MGNNDFKALKSGIHSLYWGEWPERASRNSIHERVKAEIVKIGYAEGYTGVPEFNPPGGKEESRVDVGWFDGESVVVAVEVDGTYRKKSVEKLISLPESCTKVIVSKSTNKSRIEKRCHDIPDRVKHIDAGVWSEI